MMAETIIFQRTAVLILAFMLVSCASTGNRNEPDADRRTAELNTQLGQGYMNRGEYEIALDKLKKAIQADDDYAPAHTLLAVLYEQIGEADLAGEHYRDAVRADPEDGDVNNNYGAFLCRSGRARDAEKYFLKTLDDPFYKTPEVAMANAGSCALETGHMDKAESYLRQSLGYEPGFADALLMLAALKYDQGTYLAARGFLQRYEASGPVIAESLMTGYRIETSLNNPTDARRYADRVLEQFPNTHQAEEIRGIRRK